MKESNSRRSFLKRTGQALLLSPLASSLAGCHSSRSIAADRGKLAMDTKSASLVMDVRDFGAVGDSKTKNTLAIQQAVDRCHVLGGGQVLIAGGSYCTGAIALRSNVTLRVKKE